MPRERFNSICLQIREKKGIKILFVSQILRSRIETIEKEGGEESRSTKGRKRGTFLHSELVQGREGANVSALEEFCFNRRRLQLKFRLVEKMFLTQALETGESSENIN